MSIHAIKQYQSEVERFEELHLREFNNPSYPMYHRTIDKVIKNIKKFNTAEVNIIYELLDSNDVDNVLMAKEMLKTILSKS